MLEEENKKETQESEQVPAAERIQEPEAVQSQESEPAQTQDQTPKPVRESAGHSRRRQGEDKSQSLRFGVIAAGVGSCSCSACRQVSAQPSGGSRNCKEWGGDSIRAFEGRGIRRVQSGGDQRERSSGSFL